MLLDNSYNYAQSILLRPLRTMRLVVSPGRGRSVSRSHIRRNQKCHMIQVAEDYYSGGRQ
jgi:hypothetical protein